MSERFIILSLALAVLALSSLSASAQSMSGEPSDLKFEVVNATTGEPATVDRTTIEYLRVRRNVILDFEPQGSSFIAPGVPIRESGRYIVAVWHEGVPYWWSMRGQQLLEQTTTLHIFDTTTDLTGVSIKGMNLILRRQDTLLNLEYMLQVDNIATPQKTVFDGVATFEINFPAGTSKLDRVPIGI